MSATLYTKDQVHKKVLAFLKKHGTQTAAAEAAGCHRSEFNAALAGKRAYPDRLLNAIGVERVTLYVSDLNDKFRE